jgi:protein-tyrosine phosphatase
MAEYWGTAIQFIEEARKVGGKVLIQIHGRSRSASFAVAWAIVVLNKDLAGALQYVSQKCFYRLDSQLMFMDQLKEFEERNKNRKIMHKI